MSARTLLLLRHGKSDWGSGGDGVLVPDHERPLATRGRRDCRRIGEWLAEHGPLPDLVVHSDAERTWHTAMRVMRFAGADEALRYADPELYLASAATMLGAVRAAPARTRALLVVGHNPGLDDLVLQLAPDAPRAANGKLMVTCALAVLDVAGGWDGVSGATASLRELVRPREL